MAPGVWFAAWYGLAFIPYYFFLSSHLIYLAQVCIVARYSDYHKRLVASDVTHPQSPIIIIVLDFLIFRMSFVPYMNLCTPSHGQNLAITMKNFKQQYTPEEQSPAPHSLCESKVTSPDRKAISETDEVGRKSETLAMDPDVGDTEMDKKPPGNKKLSSKSVSEEARKNQITERSSGPVGNEKSGRGYSYFPESQSSKSQSSESHFSAIPSEDQEHAESDVTTIPFRGEDHDLALARVLQDEEDELLAASRTRHLPSQTCHFEPLHSGKSSRSSRTDVRIPNEGSDVLATFAIDGEEPTGLEHLARNEFQIPRWSHNQGKRQCLSEKLHGHRKGKPFTYLQSAMSSNNHSGVTD